MAVLTTIPSTFLILIQTCNLALFFSGLSGVQWAVFWYWPLIRILSHRALCLSSTNITDVLIQGMHLSLYQTQSLKGPSMVHLCLYWCSANKSCFQTLTLHWIQTLRWKSRSHSRCGEQWFAERLPAKCHASVIVVHFAFTANSTIISNLFRVCLVRASSKHPKWLRFWLLVFSLLNLIQYYNHISFPTHFWLSA